MTPAENLDTILAVIDRFSRRLALGALGAVLVALAVVALSGCNTAQIATTATAARVGEAVYCNAITEEARQAIRDRLTGGIKVLPCLDPDGQPASVPLDVVPDIPPQR